MKARKFLKALRKEATTTLTDPKSFFEARRSEYLEIARTTAAQVLRPLRPDDISREDWESKISLFTTLTFARLLSSPDGIRITQKGLAGAIKERAMNGSTTNPFTSEDVQNFVEEAKRFDAEDSRKGKEKVATAVEHVLRNHFSPQSDSDSSGLVAAIADFLESKESDSDLSRYYEPISRAWVAIFTDRFPRDLQRHYSQRLRRTVSGLTS